ncbi:MAG: hypothetical protein B7Y41_03190 [Hydrogenophilales bacterium 28-61-23]|nr:MAG: hypothetical protein B7Y41_03190 [Hydrogenophilales bacterium 28-61-23]
MKSTLLSLTLAAALSAGSTNAATYSVTNLGLYPNNGASALAVNNVGEMGGFSTVGLTGTKQAFFASGVPNITITNLHTQGGSLLGGASGSYAAGINEAGQVVGQALRGDWSAYVPFISTNAGTMVEISPLGGTGGTARDINNAGQVVGGAYTAGNTANHAYVYNTSNATATDIGAQIIGSTTSEARGINDAGQVAGSYYTPAYAQRAFFYDGGSVTSIATPGGGNAYATGINDSGSVVGSYYTGAYPNIEQRSFLYHGANLTDLGELYAAGRHVEANGINNTGQIVGWADSTNLFGQSAFLYQNGVMTDLNTLIDPASGWLLVNAYAISNAGYIVGSAVDSTYGRTGAVVILAPAVLNPVPEPETYALMLAGLGLVGFAARRKRN